MHTQKNKPLAPLTTLKVGGNAQEYLSVSSIEALKAAFSYAKEEKLPLFILGKGSNLLCPDTGFDGLLIHNKIAFLTLKEENDFLNVHVGAGYSLSLLSTQTAQKGYSGLEFACGIPASIGGALFMNAGAHGQEVSSHLTEVEFLDLDGHFSIYPKESLHFSYRSSSFQEKRGAIVGARFLLPKSALARQGQLDLIHQRKKTQPLTECSAGCIFRNPPGEHAGALIEKCGLKGMKEGSACVSNIHANFIINEGGASAKDIENLILKIQHEVKAKTGILLESEIRRLII